MTSVVYVCVCANISFLFRGDESRSDAADGMQQLRIETEISILPLEIPKCLVAWTLPRRGERACKSGDSCSKNGKESRAF